jgi:hypothetical protein
MPEAETQRQILERMGAAKVKYLLASGGLPTQFMAEAAGWLAELDQIEQARNAASQDTHLRIALSTERASWRAAYAAIAAAIIAVLGIAATFLTWFFSSH